MVSIVVCTYNRAAILPSCLDSLAGQDYPADQFEIIVVDNNSTDPTLAIFQKFAASHPKLHWRYFKERVQGLSAARNRGFKEAQGELVAYIDDDARAAPDWVKKLVEPFQEPNIYAVGGRVDLVFSQPPPVWLGPALRRCLAEFQPLQQPVQIIDKKRGAMPFGCNLAFRKVGLEAIGGFDLQLGRSGAELLAGEETQALLQIQNQGWQVAIQPQALVEHLVPPERMDKKYFLKGYLTQKEQRLRFLSRVGVWRRIGYLVRFFLELLMRGFVLVIKIGLSRDQAQRFLQQRELFGVWHKFWLALNYLINKGSKFRN